VTHPAQGFTLVEILITMLIIGVLAAVGVGTFLPFVQRARLDNAAAETGTAIRYAISETRRNNRTVTVTFTGKTLTVKRGTATLRSVELPLAPVLSCRTTCPATYTFAAPFGTSATDFAATFTVGSRSRTIQVRGPLGMVSTQ